MQVGLGFSSGAKPELAIFQVAYSRFEQDRLLIRGRCSGQKKRRKPQIELAWVSAHASSNPYRVAPHYFAAAAFCAAQRFLTASAIRFRPSGESFLFFLAGFVATGATAAALFGLPAFFFGTGAASSLSSAFASCN
jgi:hypothetical protein